MMGTAATCRPRQRAQRVDVSDASVIASLLDGLAACLADAQLRAWLIASADCRAMMPHMVLERVEAERRRQEAFVAEAEDQAARRARAQAAQQGGHRPALLIAATRLMSRIGMAEAAFGRQAANDPRLIRDLRSGRIPGPKLRARVMAWIEQQEAAHA